MNAKYGIVFYIISTEGTLRLPKTFDNHPIPSQKDENTERQNT